MFSLDLIILFPPIILLLMTGLETALSSPHTSTAQKPIPDTPNPSRQSGNGGGVIRKFKAAKGKTKASA